jgi:beta-lactamase superfamily II metal-dependent hydrolase
LPQHGGKESISQSFIDAVQPLGVIIPVGAGNTKGDPQPETLALIEGYTVLRTDERGTIRIATDGVQLWVEAER